MILTTLMSFDLILLTTLLALSSLFSASETALLGVTKSQVDELVKNKVPGSRTLKQLTRDTQKTLITVLIANQFVNIFASVYAGLFFTRLLGDMGIGVATAFMTFLILLFGAITPKVYATEHAKYLAPKLARPIRFLQRLLTPFVWIFEKIITQIKTTDSKKEHMTEDEFLSMLKITAQEGVIASDERQLFENIVKLRDLTAKDLMTPRMEIQGVERYTTLGEAIKFGYKSPSSRLVIYHDSLDQIVGIVSLKKLINFKEKHPANKKISELKIPKIIAIPESKIALDIIKEFREQNTRIAIVIDSNGGTAGIISIEDIFLTITGSVPDKGQKNTLPFEIISPKSIKIAGSGDISEIEAHFKTKISQPDHEHESVNSLITRTLQRFPEEGENINIKRLRFKILKMNGNFVKEVKVTKK